MPMNIQTRIGFFITMLLIHPATLLFFPMLMKRRPFGKWLLIFFLTMIVPLVIMVEFTPCHTIWINVAMGRCAG